MATQTISLIIATYHRGARIASTLDSVLAQSVSPDEIIVVDDCSPDGTGAWINEHYPQVCVVRPQQNGGTSAARNYGAQAATGQILVFLDHDDELLPHAIESLRHLLMEFPEAKAAFADHTYINRVNGVTYPNHHTAQTAFHRMRMISTKRQTSLGRVYARAMYKALLLGNLLQQPWAVYRETFLITGGFAEDIRFCEDWDMYLRLTRSYLVVVSDEVISNHIVEGENLHLDPRQASMHQRVLEKCLKAEPFLSFSNRWILKRRLGMYLKMSGDQARGDSLKQAWRYYLRSFLHWPFDYVVAARAVFLPILIGLGKDVSRGRA